jgi:putative ABC transport system substrate-binding protein
MSGTHMQWLGTSVVALVLVGACAGPLAPAPAKVYRIGWMVNSQTEGRSIDTFRQSLRDLGYIEGGNLSLLIGDDVGSAERAPAIASELVAQHCDAIVVAAVAEALALKHATSTIPIVLAGLVNPVETGVVTSLARPGGNVSGIAGVPLAQRRLQLLKESVPGAARVGFLYDAADPNGPMEYQGARNAAAGLAVELLPLAVRRSEDLAEAFAAADRAHVDAMYVGGGPLLNGQRTTIVDFLSARRLPAMASMRSFVDGGALIYYNSDTVETYSAAAGYVDRILKGANPGDLPIAKASKFLLTINMKTAKALGLTIPPSVLAQATELIQ